MREYIKKAFAAAAAGTIILTGCSMTGAFENVISETIEDVKGDIFEKTRFDDDKGYTSIAPINFNDSPFYDSNEKITFGYESLEKECQKLCYDKINEVAYNISEEKSEHNLYNVGKIVIEDADFLENDIDVCVKAYTMDHPEVFWISNYFTYGKIGKQTIIQLFSNVSASQCQTYNNTLNESINEIMDSIPENLTEYQLEKYLHDVIKDGCTYAKNVRSTENGWEEFTVYGALVNGSAVCEGYAHSMCMLLNMVGIESYYANGFGENDPHMWNTVKIGENWYHLDVTWDDTENVFYKYFNVDEKHISNDHVIAPMYSELENNDTTKEVYNLHLPECNSSEYNYFTIESTKITDFEESRNIMVNDLVNAAENKDEIFTIQLSDDMDYDTAIDSMFNESPYYMFEYIRSANDEIEGDEKIKEDNLSILLIEEFNTVIVMLNYV